MTNNTLFNSRLVRALLISTLSGGWAHEISNQLGGLDLKLRTALSELDTPELTSEKLNELKTHIGIAVDFTERALRATYTFGALFQEIDETTDAAIADLTADAIKLLSSVSRQYRFQIALERNAEYRPVRIQALLFKQLIINVLLFIMRHQPHPTKIILSIPNETSLRIVSSDVRLREYVLWALSRQEVTELLDASEMELFSVLNLARELDSSIQVEKNDEVTALVIKVPHTKERTNEQGLSRTDSSHR